MLFRSGALARHAGALCVYVAVSQELERAVRHGLEERADGGVFLQLQEEKVRISSLATFFKFPHKFRFKVQIGWNFGFSSSISSIFWKTYILPGSKSEFLLK